MPHLSRQHRAILHALQDGMELTTLTAVLMERPICALSQRSGEMARKGLVTRELVEVRNLNGRPMKVLRVQLTDAGRALNLEGEAADRKAAETGIPASLVSPSDLDRPPTNADDDVPLPVRVHDRAAIERIYEHKGEADLLSAGGVGHET